MKENRRKKKSLIALLILVIIGVIGFTLAYFSDSITIGNEFQTKEYGTSVTEVFESPDNWTPGTTTEKSVVATNTGNVDEAVRISYTEEWKTKNDGTLSGWLHTDGTKSAHTTEEELSSDVRAALINFTNESDWEKVTEKGTDYYYYKYKLAEGEETSEFIDSVTFNAITKLDDTCEEPVTENGKTTITCNSSGEDYDNATYTLTLTIETVQFDKYKEAWRTSVDIALEKPVYENFAQHIITNSNPVTVENYTDGNTKEAYTFTHAATEQTGPLTDYRYIGDSPNNYVSFNCEDDGNNCETWRIIGVFTVENEEGSKEQRVKLIRGNSLATKMSWDYKNRSEYGLSGGNPGIYDWNGSDISVYLNETYYDNLSESAQSMIGSTKYYLGSLYSDYESEYGSTEEIYSMERGTESYWDATATSWIGKVGLLYASDNYQVYAKNVDNNCYNNPFECTTYVSSFHHQDKQGNPTKGWIYNSNFLDNQTTPEQNWLISPNVISSYGFLGEHGIYYNYYFVSNSEAIRPVLYLTPDIIITSGDGSIDTPYTIAKP